MFLLSFFRCRFRTARRLLTLLVFFVAASVSADTRGEINLSYTYGAETLVSILIPNVEVNFFPFENFGGYTGLSANWMLAMGHVGAVLGYRHGFFGFEVSGSESFFSRPENGYYGNYSSFSINPKITFQTTFGDSEIVGIQFRDLNCFAKFGFPFFIYKDNTMDPPAGLVDLIDKVPYDIEVGVSMRFL
jgi:hypothetical protein